MISASLQHPKRTLAAVALATVVLAGAATRVETDNTPSAWLPEDDAARETYAEFRGRFGGDTFLLVATDEVNVGAQATLSTLYDLSTRLGKLEGVVRVESPVTPRVQLARARANLDSDLKLLADAVAEAKATVASPRPGNARHTLSELSLLQAEANASLAFLLFPNVEDAERAVPLYQTAQAAALEAISSAPVYFPPNRATRLATGGLPDFAALDQQHPAYRNQVVLAMFWWAFARGGETRARPRDLKLMRDLKRADEVMRYVLKVAPKTFGGGPHLYFAMRNLAVGRGLGGKPDVGLKHFEQVAQIAPRALLPVVLRAQFHAPTLASTPRGSSIEQVEAALKAAWAAFEEPLRAVVTTPLAAGADDATQLANAAAREMARALLDDPAEAGLIVPDGVKERPPPPLPAFELRGGPGGRFLIAKDGKRASLLVVVEPDLPPGPRARVVAAVEAELQATSGLKLLLAGPELITHDLDVASQRSFGVLFPVVVVLMAGVLLYTLRRPRVVLGILACAGLAVVWTVGSLVLAGRTLNLILVVLPAILAVLTTAYSLHLVTRFLHPEQGEGEGEASDRVAAWRTAAMRTVRPCLLTALTTAAGFGSLAFSEIPPVRDLGLFAGLGVLFSFGLTFTFLPALLSLSPRVVPHDTEQANFWTASRARSFVSRLVRHAAVVLFVVFLAGLWSGLGIAKLRYESHVLKFFPEDHRLPVAFAEIEPNLYGMTPLEVWVGGPTNQVLSANTIQSLENLLQTLRQGHRDLVTRDLVPLPDRPLSAATKAALLRAELKRSGGVPGYLVQAEGRVDLRAMVACRTTFSEEFHQMIEQLRPQLPPEIKLTGAVPLLVRTQALLVETQLRSFGTALLVVTLILLFTYRSIRLVLVSLLPNVLPIAITLGAMGYLGIPLNTATVTVAGIALGLVVHDTIHFLHHHHEARLAGETPAAAVAATLQIVGRPIATTTLAVALGFGAFVVSSFQPTHYFGLLIALTCVSALACDLIALPALLLAGERGVIDFGSEPPTPEAEPEPGPEPEPSPAPAPAPEIAVDDAPPAP